MHKILLKGMHTVCVFYCCLFLGIIILNVFGFHKKLVGPGRRVVRPCDRKQKMFSSHISFQPSVKRMTQNRAARTKQACQRASAP